MAEETLQHDTTYGAPVAVQTAPQFTDDEVVELRRRLHEGALDDRREDNSNSRFGWFLIGFVAAILSIAVAALVFLAVSDEDDDGNLNVDVPAVDVDVDG
jgi:hypothetical protein